MKNFKITIAYDGSAYCGWQRQTGDPTVQAEIERALATMTRSPVSLNAAGRTDAGVHALGQVANFRCQTPLGPEAVLKGLNSLLPADIAIRDCCLMPAAFHARFDAQSKIYHYRILNRETRCPVTRRFAWFIHRSLDRDKMQAAAGMLVGRHDFKAFESTGSPRAHTIRHVVSAAWHMQGSDLMTFQIEADGFLRCMVRNIVGTLVAAGLHKILPETIQEILASRDRRHAGPAAPPHGLFLMEVKYEKNALVQPTEDPGYVDSFTW